MLAHSLIKNDLVDEYALHAYPLVLGSGKRLFPEGMRVNLKLDDKPMTRENNADYGNTALRHTASEPFTRFEGCQFGAGVSFILVQSAESGVGPELHQHPYAETFVIRSGRARFTVGSEQVIGVAGQIIVVPAETPHCFAMIGSEPLDMIDIHASDMFTTRWLADHG